MNNRETFEGMKTVYCITAMECSGLLIYLSTSPKEES